MTKQENQAPVETMPMEGDEHPGSRPKLSRAGLYGGGVGFVIGLVPLTASVLVCALTGEVIARACHLRDSMAHRHDGGAGGSPDGT